MRKGEDLVSVEITEENPAVLLRNVETSVRRIKEFGSKLEETMEKWSMAIEDKEIKQGEHEKFSEDSDKVFNLLSEANERSDQLVILEKTLKEHIASLQKPTEMTDPRLEQMIYLQSKTQEHILLKNCHFNNIIQEQEL